MANFNINEAAYAPTERIDPRGQAALLIVESLMHVLIEKRVIGPEDAVDALRSAVSVKHEMAARGDEPAEAAAASLVFLDALVRSFSTVGDGMPAADAIV